MMDEIKELEERMDKFLELKSRKQCLQELHSFALEQLDKEWEEIGLKYGYIDTNKDKKP